VVILDDDYESDDGISFEEPKKVDEETFSKRLNQPKLNKHEMDDLFLME
jgi:hypothetical protein